MKGVLLTLLGASAVAGWASASGAAVNTAMLSVPAAAILPGSDGPDDAGGFDLDIKLDGLPVKAGNCGSQLGLLVQMGDTVPQDITSDLSIRQKAQVSRKVAYYKEIMSARASGRAVTLHLSGSAKYLYQRGKLIYAPYCAVNLDEAELSP